MKQDMASAVLDALARYEVQTKWPSLQPDRVEENVSLMRSDIELVRAATVATEAMQAVDTGVRNEVERRAGWRRAGFEAAAQEARRRSDMYAAYGLSPSALDRHLEAMMEELSPAQVEPAPSPAAVVRTALARDVVANRWPSLRGDLVETNVAMMTGDRHIMRQAELAVSVMHAMRSEDEPDLAARDNRDLLDFQQAVEAASRYFVTLSAREWRPRTIGWGLRLAADEIKRNTRPR